MVQGLKLANTIVGPSEKEKEVTPSASEGHIIRDLYSFCQRTIGAIFSTFDNRDIATREWGELRGRLNTWEDGFSVMEGELDQVFVKTRDKHLREATCIILCSLARSLSIYMSSIDIQWSPGRILVDTTETLIALMPTAKDLLEVAYDSSDSEVEDLIQDIKHSVASLYDLVPSTERLFLSHQDQSPEVFSQRLASVEPDMPERKLGVGVGIYCTNIKDKFPDISDDLAICLAEMNWMRQVRIRSMKPPDPGSSTANPETPIEPSTIGKDSGVGSSIFTGDVSRLGDGGISDSRSEFSTTSRSTIPQTTTWAARIPRPPIEKLSSETSFNCTICFKQLKGIRSKRMWEEHVLKDLQPYSCLFSSCPEQNVTFHSRRLWVAHEFQYHRPQRVTMYTCGRPCKQKFRERCDMVHHTINDHLDGSVSESDVAELVDLSKIKAVSKKIICPFCLDEIGETKSSIRSHIGAHLLEVALMALPYIDTSSDTCGGSADSHNADIFGEERDPPSGISNLNPSTSTIHEGPVRCLVKGCNPSTRLFASELEYRRHALCHQNDKITCPFPHSDPTLQYTFPHFYSFMDHLKKEGSYGNHNLGSLSSCEFCYNGTLFPPHGLYNHLRDCDFSYISRELGTPEYIQVGQPPMPSSVVADPLHSQLSSQIKKDKNYDVYMTTDAIESWRGLSYLGGDSAYLPEVPCAETKESREKSRTLPAKVDSRDGGIPEPYVGSPGEWIEGYPPLYLDQDGFYRVSEPPLRAALAFGNAQNRENNSKSSFARRQSPGTLADPPSQSVVFSKPQVSHIDNQSMLIPADDTVHEPSLSAKLTSRLDQLFPDIEVSSQKGIGLPLPKKVRHAIPLPESSRTGFGPPREMGEGYQHYPAPSHPSRNNGSPDILETYFSTVLNSVYEPQNLKAPASPIQHQSASGLEAKKVAVSVAQKSKEGGRGGTLPESGTESAGTSTHTHPHPQRVGISCEMCGATFGRRVDLKRHMICSHKHTNSRKWQCATCGVVFSRKDNHQKHITTTRCRQLNESLDISTGSIEANSSAADGKDNIHSDTLASELGKEGLGDITEPSQTARAPKGANTKAAKARATRGASPSANLRNNSPRRVEDSNEDTKMEDPKFSPGPAKIPRVGPPENKSGYFRVSKDTVTVHNSGGQLTGSISIDMGKVYADESFHTDSCRKMSQKSDNMTLCFCPARSSS